MELQNASSSEYTETRIVEMQGGKGGRQVKLQRFHACHAGRQAAERRGVQRCKGI